MSKDIHKKWQKCPVFVWDVDTVLGNTTIIFKEELFKLRKQIQSENKKIDGLTSGLETHHEFTTVLTNPPYTLATASSSTSQFPSDYDDVVVFKGAIHSQLH